VRGKVQDREVEVELVGEEVELEELTDGEKLV
jgi:hypothetical protein